MARYAQAVAALLVLMAATGSVVEARTIHDAAARVLLQNQRCPAGCDIAGSGCVADATSGGYRCTKCLGKLVVNEADGTCGCPPGRYADVANDCNDCPKGSWCAGGTYADAFSPNMTDCGASLTTIGKRATSIKSCVNVAGTSYSVDASGNPSATTCPADTYGPGLRKQRTCVPCPPGYTTNTLTGQSRATACVVPEGFYLKGPGQVAPCPKGEYKAGFATVASCSKCATGVTTASQASTSEAACTTVLPGYYPSSLVSGIVKATERCPQKFYCPGGVPTAAFDPQTPAALNDTTVAACADGTWTQGIGASTASQCMTPPGYKTANGATTLCGSGEYRADWKRPSAAASCDSCGSGIHSDATDQVTAFAITADATPSAVAVRASAAACYIKAGQGMYYSAASATYKGVNCDTNNYGVANKTFGLAAFPCRDCPAGMQTSTSLASSAQFWATDGAIPVRQGFTSPMACVTKAGYGYNGRVANKCAAGSYNAAGNYGTCTQCAPGLSTADDAASQVAASDCVVAKGYGFHDGAVQPCPVGTYNDALRTNATAACTACPTGLTTSQAGGVSSTDCNVCSAGYGGASCGAQCGGASATFGPAGQPINTACQACPTMSTGFSFDYQANNEAFVPNAVARLGADSPADCLAEFAQIADSAWYLGGAATLVPVPAAGNFSACVADCQADTSCQYVTFDYDAAACEKKQVGTGTDVIAFKAVVAGDTSASRVRKTTRAKGLASGSYTFWQDNAAGVGASVTAAPAATPAATSSVQACLDACDFDASCAAVVMTGVTTGSTMASPINACSIVKGDTRVATFKRSVTKTSNTRLTLTSLNL